MHETRREAEREKVCVIVGTAYIFELPDDTGRLEVPVARAVPHPDRRLPLEHFSTQLCHRVETDLLLRCVFKVLQQERDMVSCFCIYCMNVCFFAMRHAESCSGSYPTGKVGVTERLKSSSASFSIVSMHSSFYLNHSLLRKHNKAGWHVFFLPG